MPTLFSEEDVVRWRLSWMEASLEEEVPRASSGARSDEKVRQSAARIITATNANGTRNVCIRTVSAPLERRGQIKHIPRYTDCFVPAAMRRRLERIPGPLRASVYVLEPRSRVEQYDLRAWV